MALTRYCCSASSPPSLPTLSFLRQTSAASFSTSAGHGTQPISSPPAQERKRGSRWSKLFFFLPGAVAFGLGTWQIIRRQERSPLLNRRMLDSTTPLSVKKEIVIEGERAQQIQFLTGVDDNYDGVTVNLEKPMDAEDFAEKLKASLLKWKQEGKKGIWIKMPIGLVNLIELAVKEGFRYHHAEPDYLMLVTWISEPPDTIPPNASHRVSIGAFVLNPNGEVLVVQETGGAFRGTDVWKLPTGVINQGEDICEAAVREVKEETGIVTEFIEVLAFRQSHGSFFGKSDLFFLCVLKPCSFEVQKQDSEILAVQWMPMKDYVNQPYNQERELFKYMANICEKKSEKGYWGFSPVSSLSKGRKNYMYCNSDYADELMKTREQDEHSM